MGARNFIVLKKNANYSSCVHSIQYISIINIVWLVPKGYSSLKIAHSFLVLDMLPAIKERSNLPVIRHHRVNTPQTWGKHEEQNGVRLETDVVKR